jgi:hypothetical protein
MPLDLPEETLDMAHPSPFGNRMQEILKAVLARLGGTTDLPFLSPSLLPGLPLPMFQLGAAPPENLPSISAKQCSCTFKSTSNKH